MIRTCLLILVALTGVAHAEVALQRTRDGALIAEARVGTGAPAPFIIDTGARACAVSEGFARSRGLLAVGKGVRAPSILLDGMRSGPLVCDVIADRADGVAGVIGADMLARYVVVIDTRAARLSLHGGAQHGQALVGPRARLVDADVLADGRLAAPVRLNGARGMGVIDTGARRSVYNARFAAAAGVSPDETSGAFALAGRVTPAPVSGRVADAPALAALGLSERPAMLLGLDRLDGLRLVIDYPRNRVWFDPG